MLVELVGALGVLSVGMLGAMAMYDFGLDKLRAADEARAAASVAADEIEYLRSLPFDRLAATDAAPFHDPAATAGLLNAQAVVRIEDYPGAEGRLKQVTASVAWTGEYGRTVRKSVTTLIARKEAP